MTATAESGPSSKMPSLASASGTTKTTQTIRDGRVAARMMLASEAAKHLTGSIAEAVAFVGSETTAGKDVFVRVGAMAPLSTPPHVAVGINPERIVGYRNRKRRGPEGFFCRIPVP